MQISHFYLLSGSKVGKSKHDGLHELKPVKSATSGRIGTKGRPEDLASGSKDGIGKQKLSRKSIPSLTVAVSKDSASGQQRIQEEQQQLLPVKSGTGSKELASGSKDQVVIQEPVRSVISDPAVPKTESVPLLGSRDDRRKNADLLQFMRMQSQPGDIGPAKDINP